MLDLIIKSLSKDDKGFTLIELVVVIAILAVLALIAVPRLAGTTKKAAISAHNANVRNLESAATMYIADNPGQGANWPSDESWEEYLQEWPEVPEGIFDTEKEYTVKIDEDGEIEVTPGKVDEDGDLINSD